MIPEAVVQEVLARTSILQIIGEYTKLKRVGASYMGLCPLHQEKTPSFSVSPNKGLYYCFGCGRGGDVINFLREVERYSFGQAVRQLARRVGMTIAMGHEDDTEEQREVRRLRQELQKASEAALAFFRRCLNTHEGDIAREYLQGRGILAETSRVFKLGYAPPAWDRLKRHLQQQDVPRELSEQIGLLVVREQEESEQQTHSYDRFRNRLMFPVMDPGARVVAFSGRTLDAEVTAKYINSPDSPLYTKGHNLYGIHAARDVMRRSATALVVEGNVDVLQMHQAGFRSTVAPLGTALTAEQAALLKRFVERVVLVFDGDKAGLRAARRAIKPLLGVQLEARVVILPSGEDPDSFLKVYGPDGMQELIDGAEPLVQWAVRSACEDITKLPMAERLNALEPLGEVIESIELPSVQQYYIQDSARRLDLSVDELLPQLRLRRSPLRQTIRAGAGQGAAKAADAVKLYDRKEMELLHFLLEMPHHIPAFVEAQHHHLFTDTTIRELIAALNGTATAEGSIDVRAFITSLDEEDPRRVLGLRASMLPYQGTQEALESDYRGAIARLMKSWVERQTPMIASKLEKALASGDNAALKALLERKAKLDQLRVALIQGDDRKINWATFHLKDSSS